LLVIRLPIVNRPITRHPLITAYRRKRLAFAQPLAYLVCDLLSEC
jgi:hypothetical protein